MQVNVSIIKSVKPFNEPILLETRLTDFMMWSEKTGQIECFIISYKKYTLYMVLQTKEDKTYTNYFETFEGMGSLYKALTRKGEQNEIQSRI